MVVSAFVCWDLCRQSVSVFFSRSVCLSVAQCVFQSLSVFFSRSVCLSVAQCVCQLLSVFVSSSVCFSVAQCVCQSLSVFVSRSVCLSVAQCVCQSLSVFVSRPVCLSVRQCVCQPVVVWLQRRNLSTEVGTLEIQIHNCSTTQAQRHLLDMTNNSLSCHSLVCSSAIDSIMSTVVITFWKYSVTVLTKIVVVILCFSKSSSGSITKTVEQKQLHKKSLNTVVSCLMWWFLFGSI